MGQPRITLLHVLIVVIAVGFALVLWLPGDDDAPAAEPAAADLRSTDDRERLTAQNARLRREIELLENRLWDAMATVGPERAHTIMTGLIPSTSGGSAVTASQLLEEIDAKARSRAADQRSGAAPGVRELHDEWVLLNLRRQELDRVLSRLEPGSRSNSRAAPGVSARALTHRVDDGMLEVTVEVENRSGDDREATIEIGARPCNRADIDAGEPVDRSGNVILGSELFYLAPEEQQVTDFVYPLPTPPGVDEVRICAVTAVAIAAARVAAPEIREPDPLPEPDRFPRAQ